jgi:hypothetical protein
MIGPFHPILYIQLNTITNYSFLGQALVLVPFSCHIKKNSDEKGNVGSNVLAGYSGDHCSASVCHFISKRCWLKKRRMKTAINRHMLPRNQSFGLEVRTKAHAGILNTL